MRRTLVFGTATAAVALALSGCPLGTRDERVETVYGPPPVEEDEPDPSDEEDLTRTDPSSQGEIDEPIEDVYGPPIPYDPEDDEGNEVDLSEVTALYGPPPDYDASEYEAD